MRYWHVEYERDGKVYSSRDHRSMRDAIRHVEIEEGELKELVTTEKPLRVQPRQEGRKCG